MDQPSVLRTARMGGFVKEDVLKYIDELNSKIYALEEERDEWKEKAASGGGMTDQLEQEYEAELSRLRGELGTTKNQLRAAQEELKNRPVIEGGDGSGATEELLQLRQQAAEAAEKLTNISADLDASRAELQIAQEESANLQNQILELQGQVSKLNSDNEVLRSSAGDAGAAEAVVAELQSKLMDATAEVTSLTAELEAKKAIIEEQAGLSSEADL